MAGKLSRVLGFDRGPIALKGSRASINQGQVYKNGGRVTCFAPSIRWITDFGAPCVHSALAGGASDRRFSRWYVSDLARWLADGPATWDDSTRVYPQPGLAYGLQLELRHRAGRVPWPPPLWRLH